MARPKSGDDDLGVLAAWLYYVHGLGQEQVARRLNLSRTKVTRLLAQARDTGLVKISVEHEMAETLALSDWISQRYGVEECVLTPPLEAQSSEPELAERLGRESVGIAASNYLSRILLSTPDMILGVAGGRTIARMADAMRQLSKSDCLVVAMIGASSIDDGVSSYSVALQLAATIGCPARTLPLPSHVGSPQTRQALEQDPVLRAMLDKGETAALNLLSCGGVQPGGTFFRLAGIGASEVENAIRAGAVSEIGGFLLAADGSLVDCALNERRVGISFEALKRGTNVIIASGARKTEPLKAVMKAGLARTIIIDQEIAQALARKGA